MLIGNRQRFAFEIVPVEPSWPVHYQPEAAAWAGLSIWVAGANLAAHVRDGEHEVRAALHVPLAPLADWFVQSIAALTLEQRARWVPTKRGLHAVVREWGRTPPPLGLKEDEWLDAREAFWKRHFLVAGADGARVPNVAFLRTDDDTVVTWAPPRFPGEPRLDFLHPHGEAVVPWVEVLAAVTRLVDEVAVCFERRGLEAPYDWMHRAPRVPAVAAGPDAISLYCARDAREVAALLGLPPEGVVERLGLGDETDPATSPTCQMLRDLPPQAASQVGGSLLETAARAAAPSPGLRDRWVEMRDRALDAARAGTTPEDEGRLAARALRTALALESRPVVDTRDLAATGGLAIADSRVRGEGVRMLIAATQRGTAAATILETPRTTKRWGRRFEEARALGHGMLDPLRGGVLGAASSRWAQETRRRRSGAFAAELLLPAAALEQASGGRLDGAADDDVFTALLDRYGVGARTAAHQLFNHGWLSGAGVRDDLVEAHAHRDATA